MTEPRSVIIDGAEVLRLADEYADAMANEEFGDSTKVTAAARAALATFIGAKE